MLTATQSASKLGSIRVWALRVARLVCLLVVALLALVASASAFGVLPLTGYVNDHAKLLSPPVRLRLEDRLARFQATHGPQFVVLTIESLGGTSIEEYAVKTAHSWQLGDAKRDDGLLLLVAKNDHKLRIEVGYGLEGSIPDVVAARIIREIITPAFKRDAFEYGIEAGLSELMRSAGGAWEQPLAAAGVEQPSTRASWAPAWARRMPTEAWVVIGIVLGIPALLLIGLFTMFAFGWRPPKPDTSFKNYVAEPGSSRRRSVFGSSRSSSSGGSSSSSSSSSFSGGGGGGFGGGGASGSW